MSGGRVRRGRAWLPVLCVLLAAGCRDADVPPEVQPASPLDGPVTEDLRRGPGPSTAEGPVRYDLDPVGGSAVAGSVWVHPGADETRIVVEAQAMRAGTTYAARLHSGSCDDPGPDRGELGSLTPTHGRASSETTVPIPTTEIEAGAHFVQLYTAEGAPDQAVACADLPPRAEPI
jgi:hypothetical protein